MNSAIAWRGIIIPKLGSLIVFRAKRGFYFLYDDIARCLDLQDPETMKFFIENHTARFKVVSYDGINDNGFEGLFMTIDGLTLILGISKHDNVEKLRKHLLQPLKRIEKIKRRRWVK